MNKILQLCLLMLSFNSFGQIVLTENFNSPTTPIGWTNTATTGDGWEFSTDADYDVESILDHSNNGGNYAWVDFSGTDTEVVLQLPSVDISTLTTPYIQFFYESYYVSNPLPTFNLLFLEAYNGTSWDIVTTLQGNTTFGWQQLGFVVSTFTNGSNLQLRFRAESGGDFRDYRNDILIDDIVIKEAPTCLIPNSTSISNITTSTVDVSWTESGSATNWDLAAVPQGSGIPIAVGETATTTTFIYSNLMSSTLYDIYVRSNCALNDQSDWIYVNSFQTLCATVIAPYIENFDNTFTPVCWLESGSEAWKYSTAAGFAAQNAGDYNGTGGNYAWIDGSNPFGPSQISSLITNVIDISQLSDPEVSFAVFSYNPDTNDYNEWSAVITDGSGGTTTIYSSPGPDAPSSNFGPDWRLFKYDINGLQSPIKVTFTVVESTNGTSFYNDILIDAFKIDEAICPTINSTLSLDTSVCQDNTFNLSVSGLENMDMVTNNKHDYGIEFVAFSTTPTDPYSGGTSLGTAAFASLTAANTVAAITGATLTAVGTYEIYAILSPTPTAGSCRPSAMTTITVTTLPTVTLTALADLCIASGVQTGLGGGMAIGGVYSGTGVTDDGNGMTYTFDPALAGVGVHTITYTVSNNASGTCSSSSSILVTVTALPAAPTGEALQEACNSDYNLIYSVAELWSGNYADNIPQNSGFNHFTLEIPGNISNESGSGIGTGTGDGTNNINNCTLLVGSATNSTAGGIAYLPDGQSLMLTNDSATNVFINYIDPAFGAYICQGSGTTNITLAPGNSVTLLRTGASIAPISGVGFLVAMATPAPGTSLVWYDSETGTNVVTNPTQVGQGTTMLWAASAYNTEGCESATRFSVNLTVNPLLTLSFTAPADLCLDAGIQTGLGGGMAIGGVYSGPGVIDDGNGMTYSFDPVASSVGTHTIMYTFLDVNSCTNSASDAIEVFAADDATFSYAAASYCVNDTNPTPIITGLSGGLFSSTPGLTIDSNTGLVDVAASTNGVYTVTYTTSGTCVNSSSISITIDECAQDNDLCSNATALNLGVTLSGESSAGATDDSTGVADDTDCEPSTFKADVWYTFEAPITGTVNITTVISGNSDQANVAVYSSQDCSQLDADSIACSTGNGGESVDITGLTVGQTYYVRVWSDGVAVVRNNQLTEGVFSITVTETTLSTTDFDTTTGFTYYPNPVENMLTLKSDNTISKIRVLNMLGQVVLTNKPNSTTKQLDLSNLQSGAYFVEVSMEGNTKITKIVRVLIE